MYIYTKLTRTCTICNSKFCNKKKKSYQQKQCNTSKFLDKKILNKSNNNYVGPIIYVFFCHFPHASRMRRTICTFAYHYSKKKWPRNLIILPNYSSHFEIFVILIFFFIFKLSVNFKYKEDIVYFYFDFTLILIILSNTVNKKKKKEVIWV